MVSALGGAAPGAWIASAGGGVERDPTPTRRGNIEDDEEEEEDTGAALPVRSVALDSDCPRLNVRKDMRLSVHDGDDARPAPPTPPPPAAEEEEEVEEGERMEEGRCGG